MGRNGAAGRLATVPHSDFICLYGEHTNFDTLLPPACPAASHPPSAFFCTWTIPLSLTHTHKQAFRGALRKKPCTGKTSISALMLHLPLSVFSIEEDTETD